jgi:diguanylate cyclase (GGDEF)-like protein/PAS domain S-box-containing protein
VANGTAAHLCTVVLVEEAFDLLPDATLVFDDQLCLVSANTRAVEFFGVSLDERIGQPPTDLVHPDDVTIVVAAFDALQDKDRGTCIELRVSTPHGWRLVEIIGATHVTPDGRRSVLTLRDLTERRRWELATDDESVKFRSVVQQAATLLMLVDAAGVVLSASWAATRQLKLDLEDVEGALLSDLAVPSDRRTVREELATAAASPGTSVFEASLQCADGSSTPFSFQAVNLFDDPVVNALVVSAHDISARIVLERRLSHLANHDPLTGLANRTRLESTITDILSRQAASAGTFVFFVDIDRFKPVNDLHGHDTGDDLLKALASRLQAAVRPGDLVARFGGDEFVVVAQGLDDPPALASRLESVLSQPASLGTVTVTVGASVGWVHAAVADNAPDVVAAADAAMYAIKQQRAGVLPALTVPLAERRLLAEALTDALGADPDAVGLQLWYQPVVSVPSFEVTGFEALIRWQHPTLGLLAPPRFLPVATDAGLDVVLGAWVLRRALGDLAKLRATYPGVSLAVNLSAAQMADESLVPAVLEALAVCQVSPDSLCVEVAETSMLDRTVRGRLDETIRSLASLRDVGVKVAIDDFGTGCSSLSHVRDLPADTLKVDRAFVADLLVDQTSWGIAQAVVALAHSTGKDVVAEGVSDQALASAVTALGADRAQGYLFGPPAPLAAVAAASVRGSRG